MASLVYLCVCGGNRIYGGDKEDGERMSYIVPRDKPKRCTYCNFFNREYRDCKLQRVVYDSLDKQYKNCPLIELPPHGRLIDADEPMTKISTMMQEPDYQHDGENWMVGLIMARDAIDGAPTVIEAEGSET